MNCQVTSAGCFHLFKTSAQNERDVQRVQDFLNNNELIVSWNFDLEDCDKVLRIESMEDVSELIHRHLRSSGLSCEELF